MYSIKTTPRSQSRNQYQVSTTFCKVCKDAGKSEAEYKSHNIRGYEIKIGKQIVICPTLLAQQCRYCHQNGHTVKYCLALKQNQNKTLAETETQNKTNSIRLEKQKKTREIGFKVKNTFAVLEEDSDDERGNKYEQKVEELVPRPLSKSELAEKNPNNGPLWSSIASKPKLVSEENLNLKVTKIPSFVTAKKQIILPKPVLRRSTADEIENFTISSSKKVYARWADCESSDEEDENEYC